jgi:chromosome segregation ATPase
MLDYENIEIKDLPPSPIEQGTLIGIAVDTKIEELQKELEGVKAELDASRANADDWRNRQTSMYNQLGELQERLKGILTELVNSGSIEKEYAKTIADHCGTPR